jgi:sec-independent protein translocase protein TatA
LISGEDDPVARILLQRLDEAGKLMPEIGIPELLIILVIVLILFGPSRLAGVGSALGQSIREFSQGLKGQPETDEVLEETKTDKT